MPSGIYQITNTVNGKRYIGSAVDLGQRWAIHRFDLRHGKHGNQILQRSYNKHGEAAFEFEPIELVPDKDNLLAVEQHYLDTIKPEYNICKVAGSHLGVKRSPESCARISAAKMGHTYSDESKEKISAALKGFKHSNETKARMQEAQKKRRHGGTEWVV